MSHHPLEASLALVGLSQSDLGVDTESDWLGWIEPRSVPFTPVHLPAMLDDPLVAIQLGGNALTLADTVASIQSPQDRLRTVVTALALQPRRPGFRGFPAAVGAHTGPGALTSALLRLRSPPSERTTGHPAAQSPHHLLPPGPDELELPAELRAPMARLVEAVLDATRMAQESWSRLDPDVLAAAVASGPVAKRLAGGTSWWPALDEAARTGDPTSRDAALLKLAETVAATLPELKAAATAARTEAVDWAVSTPFGRVAVSGTGTDHHRCSSDCLLVVDLGGNDLWEGTVGGAIAPQSPVAVAIDLGGNDRYQQAGEPAAQGAGLGGVGLLVDAAGDDRYEGVLRAQGAAVLGAGLLWDLNGNDRYAADGTAQGAAVFGTGVLLDENGRDHYHIHGEGQGFAGPDSGGVLVDLRGDDTYTAVRTPSGGRADPHSQGEVAANNAQGAAVGRRGDLSDGHVWAGGVGVLVDVDGRDHYRAGNFAQGSGYWLGTGMLLDGGGDDLYESVYFTQGSASHFAVGLLLDADGNDVHWLEREAGASLGYAWDGAVGVLVDAAGSDVYSLAGTGLGCAERRSSALLLELAGCDSYLLGPDARALGAVDDNDAGQPLAAWPLSAARMSRQSGVLLDLGGDDLYQTPSAWSHGPANTSTWVWPDRGHGWRGRNVGAGIDTELGLTGMGGLAALLRPW
jgi:hypothetical protein